MILVYKKYYMNIGEFGYYNTACRIYKSTNIEKIHSYIIELFNTSLTVDDKEIKRNNILELSKENINFNANHKIQNK